MVNFDDLIKLKQLLDSGAITEEEYEKMKQKVINDEPTQPKSSTPEPIKTPEQRTGNNNYNNNNNNNYNKFRTQRLNKIKNNKEHRCFSIGVVGIVISIILFVISVILLATGVDGCENPKSYGHLYNSYDLVLSAEYLAWCSTSIPVGLIGLGAYMKSNQSFGKWKIILYAGIFLLAAMIILDGVATHFEYYYLLY